MASRCVLLNETFSLLLILLMLMGIELIITFFCFHNQIFFLPLHLADILFSAGSGKVLNMANPVVFPLIWIQIINGLPGVVILIFGQAEIDGQYILLADLPDVCLTIFEKCLAELKQKPGSMWNWIFLQSARLRNHR